MKTLSELEACQIDTLQAVRATLKQQLDALGIKLALCKISSLTYSTMKERINHDICQINTELATIRKPELATQTI